MKQIFLLDMTFWKKRFMARFFPGFDCVFTTWESFLRRLPSLTAAAAGSGEMITAAFWASSVRGQEKRRSIAELRRQPGIRILMIEDGFVRSLGLGTDFYYPYSLVWDDQGIHYDPKSPSRFEILVREQCLRKDRDDLAQRGAKLRRKIVENRISKYYRCPERSFLANVADLKDHVRRQETRERIFQKVIFVPAQVPGDAALRRGGCGYDNLRLLQDVRRLNPEAFIIFKVHPDVLSGNRSDRLTRKDIARYADRIITGEYTSIECIEAADEVHTITSLSGFEALLRGKKVVCYGMPFYAGYGLTDDIAVRSRAPEALAAWERRKMSRITLDELAGVALLQYPLYYNWNVGRASDCEDIVELFSTLDSTRRSILCSLIDRFFVKPFMKDN